MAHEAVNEKKAFNNVASNLPVYIDCIYRKIEKKTPPPIYHYHSNIELLYCVEGELVVTLFKDTIILKKGDFMYIGPNTPHATSTRSEHNEHICIKFLSRVIHVTSSRKIPPEDYFISLISNYELFRRNDKDADLIKTLFFNCIENYSHNDYIKRLNLSGSIMQIMSYVFNNSISEMAGALHKTIPDVFLKVLDYIDENSATITLEQAADYCSLSYSYFSRMFKANYNISFSNYIIKKRIEKSINLMSNTNLSLNDIALECGFANLSHFIKCFNDEKDMTPKKFRALIEKK